MNAIQHTTMCTAFTSTASPRVGVVAEPQHSCVELSPTDHFLLLASDGVWEFVTPQQAVEVVGACHSPQEACCKVSGVLGGCCTACCTACCVLTRFTHCVALHNCAHSWWRRRSGGGRPRRRAWLTTSPWW